MGKLMKYEIKGNSKFIVGVLALVTILTSGIYLYMGRAMKTDGSMLGALFIGLSFMVIFGTMIGTFFYIVNSFRKELYEDRGYLTFTLPLSGKQILGAKLLVSLFWFTLLGIVITLVNAIGIRYVLPSDIWAQIPFREIFSQVGFSTVLVGIMQALLGGAITLIIIYFSMALGKVSFKNKNIGGMWFLIFLIVSFIIGIGETKIAGLVPYYINLNTFKIVSSEAGGLLFDAAMDFQMTPSMTANISGELLINIGTIIYNIVIGLAAFFGTSYLIEKKVDLQ